MLWSVVCGQNLDAEHLGNVITGPLGKRKLGSETSFLTPSSYMPRLEFLVLYFLQLRVENVVNLTIVPRISGSLWAFELITKELSGLLKQKSTGTWRDSWGSRVHPEAGSSSTHYSAHTGLVKVPPLPQPGLVLQCSFCTPGSRNKALEIAEVIRPTSGPLFPIPTHKCPSPASLNSVLTFQFPNYLEPPSSSFVK